MKTLERHAAECGMICVLAHLAVAQRGHSLMAEMAEEKLREYAAAAPEHAAYIEKQLRMWEVELGGRDS